MESINPTNNESSASLSSVSRMQINDTKAGMENIDKDKINAIILKHSKKSKFYKRQQEKEEEIKRKSIEKLKHFSKISNNELQSAKNYTDEYIAKCERNRDLTRTIVHIDMDAFYANVEIRDDPSLADKPMAVGSDSMLSTSNYIARRYGVRAAMPGFIAKELCPNLIIVPGNHRKYHAESVKIMNIISQYDSNYSAMSLDEAYCDITEHLKERLTYDYNKRTFPKIYKKDDEISDSNEKLTFGCDADECVREIRHRIYLATNLTASAGIGCNLRIAKICSDVNKPNGQFRLESDREKITKFIEELPIRKIKGIGPSTALMLDCYGIKTCKDLCDKIHMIYLLETQNTFEFLVHACRGLGSNRIEHETERKSLGHETTFPSGISNNKEEMLKICSELCDEVSEELIKERLSVYTRTRTLKKYTNKTEEIFEGIKWLFMNEWTNSKEKLRLRLIGVRVSDLKDENLVKNSPLKKRIKLDEFFKKVDQTQAINDNECLFELKNSRCFICPHCSSYIEGNSDFCAQHLDLCFTCIESDYDFSHFDHMVEHFPIEDHNPPKFIQIEDFCKKVDVWLKAKDKNVAIVHCKAGKGRTGTMISCYFLYSKKFCDPFDAMNEFDVKRCEDRIGITIPSQRRYIESYAHLLKNNLTYEPKCILLKSIEIIIPTNCENFPNTIRLAVFAYFDKKILEMKQSKIKEKQKFEFFFIPGINLDGDIRILILSKKRKEMLKVSFNTFCLIQFDQYKNLNDSSCLGQMDFDDKTDEYNWYLKKKQIDLAFKNKQIDPDLTIMFKFELNKNSRTRNEPIGLNNNTNDLTVSNLDKRSIP